MRKRKLYKKEKKLKKNSKRKKKEQKRFFLRTLTNQGSARPFLRTPNPNSESGFGQVLSPISEPAKPGFGPFLSPNSEPAEPGFGPFPFSEL